jgi:putative glutamine amidotransferase
VRRPLIVVPARLADKTSALRYAAAVNARALLTMVHTAGGEPLSLLPWSDADDIDEAEVARRLSFADGVLLPGGGDVDPARYGQTISSDEVYDVDELQDSVDLKIAAWASASGRPLLAVCRGLHVVNVALGGALEQHMASPHREVIASEIHHHVELDDDGWPEGVDLPGMVEVSCFHHQRIDQLAEPLVPLAHAADGTIEAVTLQEPRGWMLGVQWHPEDMAEDDHQRSLMQAFVDAAR